VCEKSGDAASKIHHLQTARDVGDALGNFSPHGDEARPADEVRPERVFSKAPRQRDHDVARERGGAAVEDQLLIVALEESWRVSEVGFDTENLAEQHAADPDRWIGVTDRMLVVDERRRSSVRDADKRLDLPFG